MPTVQEITVYLDRSVVAPPIHSAGRLQVVRQFNPRVLAAAKNLFLWCRATELHRVAVVAKASHKNRRLRALFVEQDVEVPTLLFMFSSANIRTWRNILVHSGVEFELPTRILDAWRAGVQDKLIAEAKVVGNELLVRDCALKYLAVPFGKVKALQNMPPDTRESFELASDGSYLYWPARDIHLDLDALRYAVDPEWRRRRDRERMLHNSRFGAAVASLRKHHQLTQTGIEGVSEREIRRIEKGSFFPRFETLELMAKAHRMTADQYLAELTRRGSSKTETK